MWRHHQAATAASATNQRDQGLAVVVAIIIIIICVIVVTVLDRTWRWRWRRTRRGLCVAGHPERIWHSCSRRCLTFVATEKKHDCRDDGRERERRQIQVSSYANQKVISIVASLQMHQAVSSRVDPEHIHCQIAARTIQQTRYKRSICRSTTFIVNTTTNKHCFSVESLNFNYINSTQSFQMPHGYSFRITHNHTYTDMYIFPAQHPLYNSRQSRL